MDRQRSDKEHQRGEKKEESKDWRRLEELALRT